MESLSGAMFGALEISTSGLVAQRIRMDTIAGNVANAFTLQRADGQPGPYRRRVPLFAAGRPAPDGRGLGDGGPGVRVVRIVEDPSPPRYVYDPDHPLAIRTGKWKGYVAYPNVDLSTEMVNAIEAARAYEANVTAMAATKSMISNALRLLA